MDFVGLDTSALTDLVAIFHVNNAFKIALSPLGWRAFCEVGMSGTDLPLVRENQISVGSGFSGGGTVGMSRVVAFLIKGHCCRSAFQPTPLLEAVRCLQHAPLLLA